MSGSHLLEIIGYAVTGLVAGLLGGLLGIGGGAVMVPGLNLVLHKDMQLAIASSLFCMVFLSAASAYGHWKNGFILRKVLVQLVPLATASAVAGVYLGGTVPVWVLYLLFAVFLIYTAFDNIRKIASGRKSREPVSDFTPPNRWLVPLIAVPMGLSCGMLGIGGGVIAVPALNMFLKLPLKNAIANSAATILFSSLVAAVVKLRAINGMEVASPEGLLTLQWYHAVALGGLMVPTALIFGRVGSHLTKVSPTKLVRAIFVAVLLWAGFKYAGQFWKEVSKPASPPAAAQKATADTPPESAA